jgi:hypothetical protein
VRLATCCAKAGENVSAVTHDWWAYMLVTGCGGAFTTIPTPTVRYRQHGGNQFGSNISLRAHLERARLLLRGRFRGWVDANVKALQGVRHMMTPREPARAGRVRGRAPTLAGRPPDGLAPFGHLSPDTARNLGIVAAALINRL